MTMETAQEKFLKYDYAEAKDLCKQFLTLISGVIVLALTFADKVIDFGNATLAAKRLLFASWSCLFLSLIGCGTSLAYIALAAGRIVYHERTDYYRVSLNTLAALVVSGGLFVAGLILLAMTTAQRLR